MSILTEEIAYEPYTDRVTTSQIVFDRAYRWV